MVKKLITHYHEIIISINKLLLLVSLSTICYCNSNAQEIDIDYRAFRDQYQAQFHHYQHWLDNSGLANYLHIYKIDIQKNEINLYLSLPFEDPFLAKELWSNLQDSFSLKSPISLAQKLFYKASFVTGIPEEKISVQIFDTYNTDQPTHFMRAIYFDEGEVKISENNPRTGSRPRKITMRPHLGSVDEHLTIGEYRTQFPLQNIYDCIIEYIDSQFLDRFCDTIAPRLNVLERSNVLRLSIFNCCEMALEGVMIDNQTTIFEVLYLLFAYEATEDGFQIIYTVEGKYGDSTYQIYPPTDFHYMEPKWDDFLGSFADKLGIELRRQVVNCR